MNLFDAESRSHTFPHFPLTSSGRESKVRRKEPKNSEDTAASAPVSIAVFLRLQNERTDVFYVGRAAAIQHPQGENCPPVCIPVLSLPTSSVRRLRTSRRGHTSDTGDVSMPHGAPSTPGNPSARHISFVFGLIADTLEWPNEAYQAFITRLLALGVAPHEITLSDVIAAYAATRDANGGAPGTDDKAVH
ncbi:TPA: hypothetical protein ACG4ML_003372 [Stenotrophomonas maltophilia]|uniref:hypothetical protein n=1 Tax=Stenotrophomonas maltophilia TaxID=40324 RepID=UPI001F52E908|nr:hypothetical protein [Stenotrophomonas maltophilia]MDG9769651.1 hypothetical protein [Stenotrophomonas maltophilia]MDH0540029.1 hypothetical protein [Stenotrophomonas maltophilia]MDH0794119.1 hypothetical protein [Stenotrophomonas maltophilia]MDH2032513.1 hypothetical protein [Stenotrophomonas maltophilia]